MHLKNVFPETHLLTNLKNVFPETHLLTKFDIYVYFLAIFWGGFFVFKKKKILVFIFRFYLIHSTSYKIDSM
jgi:hypothetical protein